MKLPYTNLGNFILQKFANLRQFSLPLGPRYISSHISRICNSQHYVELLQGLAVLTLLRFIPSLNKNRKKNYNFYCFVTSLWLFISGSVCFWASRVRIRIRKSEVRIRGSGSAPGSVQKCHGSATLLAGISATNEGGGGRQLLKRTLTKCWSPGTGVTSEYRWRHRGNIGAQQHHKSWLLIKTENQKLT